MSRTKVACLVAGLFLATIAYGEVLAPAGAVGIAYGPQEILVAVDANNEGKEADGIVDYVFTFYLEPRSAEETKTPSDRRKTVRAREHSKARQVHLDHANVEYWGDRLIVTSESQAFALELSMKGSAPTEARRYPEQWRIERHENGLGLARLRDHSGSIRLWPRTREGNPDTLRRAEWWPDEQDYSGLFGGGGHSPSCQTGGFGASSCNITCGIDPAKQSAGTTCHPPLYACCYCDYARAYAVCRV